MCATPRLLFKNVLYYSFATSSSTHARIWKQVINEKYAYGLSWSQQQQHSWIFFETAQVLIEIAQAVWSTFECER